MVSTDTHHHFFCSDMFIFDDILLKLNKIDLKQGEYLHINELRKRLCSVLKSNVKIDTGQDNTLDRYQHIMSGVYLEEYGKILLIITASEKTKGVVCIEDLDRFKFCVAQIVQHEYIHHLQHIKREELIVDDVFMCKQCTDHQRYLATYDEIDAYAYDVVLEFKRYGWGRSDVLELYKKEFSKEHPVVKRLLKKTYKKWELLNERNRTANARYYDKSKKYGFGNEV